MGNGTTATSTSRSLPITALELKLHSVLVGTGSTLTQQFCRYLVVGGIAFVIDFGLLYSLTEFGGCYYLVSAAVGFLCGVAVNYYLSRIWVFDRRRIRNTAEEFLVFAVIGLIGLGINEGIIWFVREGIHWHYAIAKPISAGIVLIWNFGARKLLLFR